MFLYDFLGTLITRPGVPRPGALNNATGGPNNSATGAPRCRDRGGLLLRALEYMDRTIHYFQDRTEYGSYDPLFPG